MNQRLPTQPAPRTFARKRLPMQWRFADSPHLTEDTGATLPGDLVGAVVPQQILHDDEIVILLTKPSILFIAYSSFRFVLATLLLGVLAAQITLIVPSSYFNPTTVALATVLVAIGRVVWALLVWTSHVYMLTNQRIVTIKGVVNVHMFQAHLRKIQKTDLYQPLVYQILGTGTLAFSTAASSGDSDSTWVMIANPLETHQRVIEAIHKSQSR